MAPVCPLIPVAPTSPLLPLGPVEPVKPVSPVSPGIPCGPVPPEAPVCPLDPGGPVIPVDPTGPRGPVSPVKFNLFNATSYLICDRNCYGMRLGLNQRPPGLYVAHHPTSFAKTEILTGKTSANDFIQTARSQN